MTDTPRKWYNQKIADCQAQLANVQNRILRISLLRIILFCLGVGMGWGLWEQEPWLFYGTLTLIFVPFIFLIKVHNKLFNRKEWLRIQEEINKKELMALKNDYSEFDQGSEFIDTSHPYSYDLDVFGPHSLFQAINRTCTHIGRLTLANWLNKQLTDREEIKKREGCVEELSRKAGFREEFRIIGLMNHSNGTDIADIRKWIEKHTQWGKRIWVKSLIFGVPATNILLLLGGWMELISFSWLGLSISLFVIISFGIIKHATQIQEEYGRNLKILSGYARLIELSEKEKWTSQGMQELIKGLKIEGKSPVDALKKLGKELDRLDLRNNQLLYILLEGCIFFQLRQMVAIEKWKNEYGRYLMNWLETIGKVDALCSMGNFAFNHPDYTYPQIAEKSFCFEATELGHPLMKAETCVKNNVEIPSEPYFLIITGANMAGKSTYLRTIGSNYLLACIGCPVCASQLKIYPAQLMTSLRTSDSLNKNESYFFAELKRLKQIIDLLKGGVKLFIILDEILKGTNSTDKQKGSFNLIQQLIQLKTAGIIATHDLMLGKLAGIYPEKIKNFCFEAEIKNDELTFNYKLQEGIAQNMNACFLMKKMGITIDDQE